MPNAATLAACGTANPLSLSRVTVAEGSNDPESRAGHDSDIERALAA